MTAIPDDERAAEARLVARARSDPEAFACLYDRHVTGVYRYVYRRTGSHEDAEDITARTFHRALERLDGYEDRGLPFGAWLYRIAHNAVVDHYRGRDPATTLDGLSADGWQPPSDEPLPEDALVHSESVDEAWAAVARLPLMQRRAVTLYVARELSHAEVGRIIGRSETATKQLVYRAVKTLRLRLAAGEAG
jgi:RNA polymerase sigma-70 factor (ECF subfamily)